MEFPFDINSVLPLEVTIINGDFRILNHGHAAKISASEKLTSIIDAIGEASYKAQGLPGPVTTTRKFRISDHRLYIIKNSTDNNNRGSIIGFLKVGEKRLYVYDSHGQVHERTPICVLDFYVHESKQRSGYGKKLFDVLLEFEKCHAYELAIDRPSNKCLGFLQKHFNLAAPIRQMNNFVVFNAFFNRPPISQNNRKSRYDQSLPVDNFRRQDYTSWLLPSETQNSRPISEQNPVNRYNRLRSLTNDNDSLRNQRQGTITNENSTMNNNERKPLSAFATSQNRHYNSNHELSKTNEAKPPIPQIPRTYTQLFNENDPFPSLQRYRTNPAISTTKPNPQQAYTYKDYQAASTTTTTVDNSRKTINQTSEPVPLTSIYTFPSLIKPNNNWRTPYQYQQQSTIDASSSAWRLFGVNRLLN